MTPYITKGYFVHPKEADIISKEYLNIAQQVESIAAQVRSIHSELDSTWTGNAKNIFFSHYESLPGEIDQFISVLHHAAEELTRLEVWVEEQVWSNEIQL